MTQSDTIISIVVLHCHNAQGTKVSEDDLMMFSQPNCVLVKESSRSAKVIYYTSKLLTAEIQSTVGVLRYYDIM